MGCAVGTCEMKKWIIEEMKNGSGFQPLRRIEVDDTFQASLFTPWVKHPGGLIRSLSLVS